MINIEVTTPALLFPAISLLLLAYTNRFLVIAQLIRSLYSQYAETEDSMMKKQITHLKHRIRYIRWMQIWGVGAFILCTLAMILSLLGWPDAASVLFVVSLVALLISLLFCIVEIYISGYALNMQLRNLEKN